MSRICYFCGQNATSDEHAPPKCIFPEQKDTSGKDYRLNLIKVPSCDLHNTQKSKEDEYLMFILVSYFQNNSTASNQIKTKITRALIKSPSKAYLLKNAEIINLNNKTLLKIELDTDRFMQSLELMAHAIYFHSHNEVLNEKFKFISAPIFEPENDNEALEVNKSRIKILEMVDNFFLGLEKLGDNQEVFWYQLTPKMPDGKFILRMCFYEAFPVVLTT